MTRISWFGLIIVINLFHTLPWLLLHADERKSLARFEDQLTREVEGNSWAAGWGYYKLGKYLRRKGEVNDAFSAYENAIAANPGYSVLYEKIGLEIDPENENALRELICLYRYQLQNPGQAEKMERGLKGLVEDEN